MPSSTTDVPVRTYELELEGGGTVRFDIPETWKVTYGPIIGASPAKVAYAGGSGIAFRAWEGDTKQRLLVTGVRSFRDLSIPMTVLAIRPFGWDTWHCDNEEWNRPENADLIERKWMLASEVSVRVITPRDLRKGDPKNTHDDDDDDGEAVPRSFLTPRSWKEV